MATNFLLRQKCTKKSAFTGKWQYNGGNSMVGNGTGNVLIMKGVVKTLFFWHQQLFANPFCDFYDATLHTRTLKC